MSTEKTLYQVRRFLFVITAGVFIMTLLELVFLEHWNLEIQILPFILIVLGVTASVLAYFKPTSGIIKFTRWSMIVIAFCSLIGFYEHMINNYTFWLEIQPDASTKDLILATFQGGIPVLAPGILTLGGAIGWTATYKYSSTE